MDDVHFSWSDSIHAAFSSCLPCLKPSDVPSDTEDQNMRPPRSSVFAHAVPPPRARPDELEGLLADASDDADALSLHTNPGERRRKKRHRPHKHIRFFGYDLFGRAPAIQLPESDDEGSNADAGRRARRGAAQGEERSRTISSSSMDSDAAPLDTARIEELSAARIAEARAREEEERRAKEERRQRRRERKELKKAAMARALDLQANGEHDFEGFQGSGPAFAQALTSPFGSSLTSGTGSTSSHREEFGPFAHGQPVEPFDPDAAEAAREAAEAEAEGADFGGESYTSRPRKSSKSGSANGSGTMTTSDTRSSSSRGTGSGSHGFVLPIGGGPAPYNHQFLAQALIQPQLPLQRSPLAPHAEEEGAPSSPLSPTGSGEKGKRKRRKSKAASLSLSNSNSSQSATASSLMSPPPSEHAAVPAVVSPGGDDFEGFPGELSSSGELMDVHGEESGKPAKNEYLPVAGFPSVGLRGMERRNSDMGVFLARRGDE